MRNSIIALLLGTLLSCSDEDSQVDAVRNDGSISSLNGTWKVISFEDHSSNTVELKSEENSRGLDIVVTFDDNKDPNGLSGMNTTNAFEGSFEYTGPRVFKIADYWTTQVAQPAWADMFNEAMADDHLTFEINSKALRIYYHGESKSVTLIRD